MVRSDSSLPASPATPAPAAQDRATHARSFAIAYTSYVVRLARGRNIFTMTGAPLPGARFFALCAEAGAAGAQMDVTQLETTDTAALTAVRAEAEARGLFLELSTPVTALESAEAFRELSRIARALGVSRVRVPLLSGRRYESFATFADWRAFAERWQASLVSLAPVIDRERIAIAIENHKDWLAPELAALLRRLDSEYVGACLDFGNNLSLLEDPLATVEALAPFAVTTHLKDMAVRRTTDGFELSEVPLGEGILPLAQMIERVRGARPGVHFCLEMITRDPLPVPYRAASYWTTREGRDEDAQAAFERTVLARSTADLPQTRGLSAEAAIALEDEHVRRCAAHARDVLGLA